MTDEEWDGYIVSCRCRDGTVPCGVKQSEAVGTINSEYGTARQPDGEACYQACCNYMERPSVFFPA